MNSRMVFFSISVLARFLIVQCLVYVCAALWVQRWLPDWCSTLGGEYRWDRSLGYYSGCWLEDRVLFHEIPSVVQTPLLGIAVIGAILLAIIMEGALWLRRHHSEFRGKQQ